MDHLPKKAFTGIIFMLVAIFIYSLTNVVVKSVAPNFPIMELVFFRNLFALIPAGIMVLRQRDTAHPLQATHIPYQAFCGIVGTIGVAALFKSFELLPLADATCYAYASILFITALSWPMLKEHVEGVRWIAVLIGFVGIIIMAKPTGAFINQGILYSLVFALVDAFVMLSSRKLAAGNKPGTIVFYFALFATIFSGLFMPFMWKTPDIDGLIRFAAIGLGGGTAQICVTQAYRYAKAGTLAPMIYSSMLWSVLFGYLIWKEVPATNLWVGGAVIISCGLFIIYRENKEAAVILDNK